MFKTDLSLSLREYKSGTKIFYICIRIVTNDVNQATALTHSLLRLSYKTHILKKVGAILAVAAYVLASKYLKCVY